MGNRTNIRLQTFTFEEFQIIKEILIEWNYEWLEYNLIHDNDNEFVDLTFFLDDDYISQEDFIRLVFDLGYESVYRQKSSGNY